MRSSRRLVIVIALALAGCGSDTGDASESQQCATSVLTYDNFGAPFMLDWCRGCHSSTLSDGMRQMAPLDVNFDDLDLVRAHASKIALHATGDRPTMPPASGPSAEEREMLAEWIACGAK